MWTLFWDGGGIEGGISEVYDTEKHPQVPRPPCELLSRVLEASTQMISLQDFNKSSPISRVDAALLSSTRMVAYVTHMVTSLAIHLRYLQLYRSNSRSLGDKEAWVLFSAAEPRATPKTPLSPAGCNWAAFFLSNARFILLAA